MIFWHGSSADEGNSATAWRGKTRNQKSADSPVRTVVSGGIGLAD